MDVSQVVAQRVAEAEAAEAEAVESAERDRVRSVAAKWLEQWGLEAKLPPGVQSDSFECVLAHALGGQFPGDSWELPEDRLARKLGYESVSIPDDVREFIRRFDSGEYPDLIECATDEGSAA